MQIVAKKLSEIRPYSRNPRKNGKAVDAVAKSIGKFGFKVPVVIDSDGVIVAGHTRYLASQQLRLNEIPCIIADDLTEKQVKAFRLADNRTAELAEWDFELLDLELDSITDIDMSDFGFDISDFECEITSEPVDERAPSMQHNCFENQDLMQFECTGFYGIPEMSATQTTGNKMLRFCDFKEVSDPENYIAHFYYDDYKFISARIFREHCRFYRVIVGNGVVHTGSTQELTSFRTSYGVMRQVSVSVLTESRSTRLLPYQR